MPAKKYVSPTATKTLTSVIVSGIKTPIVSIKYCNLIKPFYYPNSPNVPRFSLTCVFDPAKHKKFLDALQDIEKGEKVESIIKMEMEKIDGEFFNTGKYLIKFQDRNKVPIYSVNEGSIPPDLLELEDEFDAGEQVSVTFNVLRYTKKNTMNPEHGISFVPTQILHYAKE